MRFIRYTMTKKIIYLSLIFAAFLFGSCEGNTNRNYTLINASSHEVTAKIESVEGKSKFQIPANQSKLVLSFNQRGGSSLAGHPSDYIFRLDIYNVEDTCFKDYTDPEKWNIISEEQSKVPSNWQHGFTFKFSDEDF